MRVFLTFDVEIWCGGWDNLDERFPAAYRRYVYGAAERDGYALPMTLRILSDHGLKAVFFVEPLFSARFGADKLKSIVDLIQDAGQEIQLHLHPEWCDEATILSGPARMPKRPNLWQFDRNDQEALIRVGTKMLKSAGVQTIRAFRAGSFAANVDTLRALANAGYEIDSSLNATVAASFPGEASPTGRLARSLSHGIVSFPIGVFADGFGRMRHAQVGACSYAELAQAIERAAASGWQEFVLLSHGFELMKPGRVEPDPIVVQRFLRLCALLRARHGTGVVRVSGFNELNLSDGSPEVERELPRVSRVATLTRYLEQARRRIP